MSPVRQRMGVFKIQGFVRKRFLPSPPLPPPFFFWLSPHFLRRQNAENLVPRSFFAPKLYGNACYAGYPCSAVHVCTSCIRSTRDSQFQLNTPCREEVTSALSPVTCSVAGKFITDAMFSIIGLRTELGGVHAIQCLRLTVANYSVATD